MTHDSRLSRMIDDHVTGRYHPDAPFNQVDDPLWMCIDCEWYGEDPNEKECREVSEAWGMKAVTKTIEYSCPKCGGDATEYDGRYEAEGPEFEPEEPCDE